VRRHVRRPDLAVSLLLTGDQEMGELHERFCQDPSTTDVLSFESDDGVDVAVNSELAARTAAADGHAVEAELALYIVHGILHVCGYDDGAPAERRRMRDAERQILTGLGLKVSPVDG
jgi:probable rRNA maturation factor